MRSKFAVILFCSFVFCGYKLAIQSWGGTVYVYLGEERAPAAVRNSNDYSAVKKRALGATVEAQLLAEAEVTRREGLVGIYLGNPLVRTQSGNEFACRVAARTGLYDRIEMTFMGTGVSTSGDSPEMVVESPCEAGQEPSTLQPIWIPVQQILNMTAKDMELQTEGDHPVNIRLRQMSDEWPPQWVLTKVKLYSADDGEYFLEIDTPKLRAARSAMLSFDSN